MPAGIRNELLFIGDVHLGRRPVGIDEALSGLSLSPRELSPAAALRNTVDQAIANPPRAVVFAGDLVDQDDDRFEAYEVLEREVTRLAKAGIPVVAIAGNHDGVVLPRLIERVEGVRLLGANGVWERWEVPGDGRPIDLIGWSFPRRHFAQNPLDHGEFSKVFASVRSGATVIGVLHADLDAGSSNYAPVSRTRLEGTGLDAWFLGHVHKPHDLSGPRPIGYLGSLVGLDVGESGPRGAWRVNVTEAGVQSQQQRAEPIRWEYIDVELIERDCEDVEGVHLAIENRLREWTRSNDSLNEEFLRVLVARVRLTGELVDRKRPRELVAESQKRMLTFTSDEVPIIVQRVRDDTHDVVDLKLLAEEHSPVGYIAQHILNLENGAGTEELERAKARIQVVVNGGWNVDDEDYPLPSSNELLQRAARRVLSTLLEQRREVGA